MKEVSVIGGGISGLAAACYSAQSGHSVNVYEKNSSIGGRARLLEAEGFRFDMGPSWYWMPDIIENFFRDFGKSASDYYELIKLDPGFQIFFGKGEVLKVPAARQELYDLFESLEKGSAAKLKKFLSEGELKYRLGMQNLAYMPSVSPLEFMDLKLLPSVLKMRMFQSIHSYVRSHFKDERIIRLMEFPSLFLGAMPRRIPALYSLMNYSALSDGTFYPMGGMHRIVSALEELARSLGVNVYTNSPVTGMEISNGKVHNVTSASGTHKTGAVIASADYHHVEQHLVPEQFRNYSAKYWSQRTMAPSSLLFYVGVNKKISGLLHHNLFFDSDFDTHAREIYEQPRWPSDPLFYVCCPSKTDPSVAPEGMENLFILIPVASGISDSDAEREKYFDLAINRIEQQCGVKFRDSIVYSSGYSGRDFSIDYNAFKGNAYGLANTLRQTAFLKPSVQNKRIKNLFYTGQLTVPGPGVPPAFISGKIAASRAELFLSTRI